MLTAVTAVPRRAQHRGHLEPAPGSMAKAVHQDEMLANFAAAAFHLCPAQSLLNCWIGILYDAEIIEVLSFHFVSKENNTMCL